MASSSDDYDVLIIGSGFGGAVSALRLAEKGYRVGLIEAGRRHTRKTLPKTSWDLRNFLWLPWVGLRGIQRLTLLRDVLVLGGAGVGGGSLVYACTLYEPGRPFFGDPHWAHITDWEAELTPFYDQARRMLGVRPCPVETPGDRALREVARDLGREHTVCKPPVGIYFNRAGQTDPDPYFGGAGPQRIGCTSCGECMTGCRVGAKNTLQTNYLYLAERQGVTILPEHEVVDLVPAAAGGYVVSCRRPGAWWSRRRRVLRAPQVILSCGALGTQKLLHRLKDDGRLPRLSGRLGWLTRTNSESILGASARSTAVDHSRGVAITSSFHPDELTHVEVVRYGKGSNAMGLLSSMMVDGGGTLPRWLRTIGQALRRPLQFLRSLSVWRWSERTIIVLVMQSIDNSIRVFGRRGWFGHRLTSEQGHGVPNPSWIPVGNEVTRRLSAKLGGDPRGSWNEILLDIPATAHFLGGCAIATSPDDGVVDPYQRVFGYPGLHIADGSVVCANLGVNPSLTITAMTERAMAAWPNRGEPDRRPPLGAAYVPVAAVSPRDPAVPASAPGALRLPAPQASTA